VHGIKFDREVWPSDKLPQQIEIKDLLEQGQVVLHWVNDLNLATNTDTPFDVSAETTSSEAVC
jgi:hypothetical protein